MNKSPPATLALLLATCVPGAFAASSMDLSVTGTITPSSCTPSLSGGGVVDHGKLSAKDLHLLQPTPLQEGEMQLQVHCEGSTLFTLTTVDNRAGSSAIDPYHHGLGMVNGDQKLGSVALEVLEPVADTAPVQTIESRDGGTTWGPSNYLGHAALTSFAAPSAPQTPIALQDLTARLRAATVIAPAGDLGLLDELPIDGHATMQIKYW
ncbi:MAG: Protein GltF [Pseudomonas sp.]|nr:MAG: Protein GltF [Pseudomonas sp.]